MGEVFQELKRRNIFRVAVAYVMLSWVLLQAVGLIAPGLGLPDWTFPLVFLFLIIGFPLALIFAWAFELTPEGPKRAADVHPENSMTSTTGRKLDFIIIAFLSVALLFFLVDRLFMPNGAEPDLSTVATAGSWSSIAVMPFANMSGDPEQEYFSDGISEELLNVLAKAQDLRVAARTSSFSFKGKDTAIPEIGSLFSVETVLEGSVRKSANKLRITAQLIDVATGYHIWSETYDREARDIFQIQDEIAGAIASAMSTHLPGLGKTAEPKHQPSLDAYNYYLAGRRLIEQRTPESVSKAIDLFGQAIASDPLYAAAYANKAQGMALSVEYGRLSFAEAKPVAVSLLDTALKLDPDLAEAYAVHALIYDTGIEEENEKAISDLERAVSLNPNLTEAHLWLASSYGQAGRPSDALHEIERAYKLDPLHPVVLNNYSLRLMRARRYSEADAILEKKEFVDTSHHQRAATLRLRINIAGLQGDITGAYRLFRKLDDLSTAAYESFVAFSPFMYLSLKEPGEALDPMRKVITVRLYVAQGKTDKARSVLESLSEQELNEPIYRFAYDTEQYFLAFHIGSILTVEGDIEAAVEAFEQVPNDRLTSVYSPYGTWYAWSLNETGRQQEAFRVLDQIMKEVDKRNIEGSYWRHSARLESEVQLLRGNSETAIGVLEDAYEGGTRVRVWRDYPLFAPIKDHPRFVALFDKIDEDFRLARIEVGLDEPAESDGTD